MSDSNLPKVLLFSGKRKSGKDHLTEWLLKFLNQGQDVKDEYSEAYLKDISYKPKQNNFAVILRLSGPLKKCYAENNGLDFQALLSADGYKEKYRMDMIRWSEEIRYVNKLSSHWQAPSKKVALN